MKVLEKAGNLARFVCLLKCYIAVNATKGGDIKLVGYIDNYFLLTPSASPRQIDYKCSKNISYNTPENILQKLPYAGFFCRSGTINSTSFPAVKANLIIIK
jgi:hypothetical protein